MNSQNKNIDPNEENSNKESNNINVKEGNKNDITTGVINPKKQFFPLINYKKYSILSDSIINYMAIGISLFIYGYINLKWFRAEYNTRFLIGYYLISGIVLYIIGIFDWYKGKELIFLIDFIYSFHFISLFLTEKKIKFGNITTDNDNNKLHGTYYVLFVCLIFCITISSKNKGKIYIIDYVILFCGYVFLFFYKYIETDWVKKVHSFIFIVSGGLFWITGMLKMIDNGLPDYSIRLLQPSD